MKKFEILGRSLTKAEQKQIGGGSGGDSCNAFCTSDSQCTSTCTKCVKMANWDRSVCERPDGEQTS